MIKYGIIGASWRAEFYLKIYNKWCSVILQKEII